jgi:ABA sandwich protein
VSVLPTGRDLDRMIAEKVMGDVPGQAMIAPYSTDIRAAWDVVEKMRPHALHLFAPGALINDEFGEYTTSWMAQFVMWGKPNGDRPVPDNWYGGPAFAESAPLAIARAALLAVGGTVGGEST